MADDINVTEKLMELVEQQGKMSIEIKSLTRTVDDMNTKLDKLDKLTKNDIIQDEQIRDIQANVSVASEKIKNLDERITKIEKSPGEAAKRIILETLKYAGVAALGAIIANAKDIISLFVK